MLSGGSCCSLDTDGNLVCEGCGPECCCIHQIWLCCLQAIELQPDVGFEKYM